MESLDPAACLMDELLNFSSDIGEEDEEEDKPKKALASSLKTSGLLGSVADTIRPFHDFVEEELEWISNKDSFPAVDPFVDILSEHPSSGVVVVSKLHSPVSVLEGGSSTVSSSSNNSHNSHSNSSNNPTSLTSCFGGLKAPCRARSKRRSRRRRGSYADISGRQLCWSQANNNSSKNDNGNSVKHEKVKPKTTMSLRMMTTIGRKCQHCGAEKTPQWRAGPYGPKTLCNACGVRYKSGRLVPEYRPASSPSFSSELHSNSHRKIVEMRRLKQMMGMVVKHPLESG